mgnify:CR=1 FL=1
MAHTAPTPPRMRSWLFAPGDSEKKMGKAIASPADIALLDLEDSVSPENKPAARAIVAEVIEVKPQVVERDELTREREARASRFYDARREEQAQASAAAAQSRAERANECNKLRRTLAEIPEGLRYYQETADGQRNYLSDEELDTTRRQLRDRVSERCS